MKVDVTKWYPIIISLIGIFIAIVIAYKTVGENQERIEKLELEHQQYREDIAVIKNSIANIEKYVIPTTKLSSL